MLSRAPPRASAYFVRTRLLFDMVRVMVNGHRAWTTPRLGTASPQDRMDYRVPNFLRV
jgi:hypothetical protein